ncbi:MAG: glycosyltransferase [Candidatus Brocadiales bacterium]|nr:glycosyltransferase [Candidatus Brocadiales bacterium]
MTNNLPLVSVILPTYNCAAFLPHSIGSILAQTYHSYEVIVVDDGSTDITREALHPFMQKIKYIRFEYNKGLPTARNAGIQSAQGKYIAFIDADDLWLPDKLETDVGYFQQHPEVSMVFSKHINIDDRGCVIDGNIRKQLPYGNIFIPLYMEQNFIISSSVVVRKEVFETAGLFDERFFNCQDWDMWLRIAFHFKAVGINKTLVKYRHNPHSLSKNRNNVLKYQKIVIDKIYTAFKSTENGITETLYKKRLASHYAKVGRYYLRIGDKNRANENFGLSLKNDPLNFRSIRYYLCMFFHKSK